MSTIKDPFNYPTGKIPNYYAVNNVVIFFDVVGFTKSTTNAEMKKVIQRIDNTIDTLLWDPYDWDEKEGNDLILIPTGDGYAIGFHPRMSDSDDILRIATDLFRHITNGDTQLRMGIAKGPNIRYLDKNDKLNLFGYGINLANRVMSMALSNQILVHADYARDLIAAKPVPGLNEIKGFFRVKHMGNIRVYNYYQKSGFGNPRSPVAQS